MRLEVKNLSVFHELKKENIFSRRKLFRAVNDVNFLLERGEILGVVGESGCGKSTLARAILGLNPKISGEILYDGRDVTKFSGREWVAARKNVQMIFQDPLASLNPRMNVGEILNEPLGVHFPMMTKVSRRKKISEMIEKVGLLPSQINAYPHELSGGQNQRVGIARALIVEPRLVICDEPVSALDVSIQSQIVNLLKNLQRENNQSLIFIAHDLSVVRHISSRVLVMYLGNVVELAPTDEIYDAPRHPYTSALISAVPIPDPKIEKNRVVNLLPGDLPSPLNPPSGCVFHTRCVNFSEECAKNRPVLSGGTHKFACFHPVN